MKRSLQAIVLGCLLLLTACGKAPKHTRYIPADATFVVGISTEDLLKKVSWKMLSGSPMMKEMTRGRKNSEKNNADALEKSGIEWMSTIYAFGRPNERYSGGTQSVVVAPLKSRKDFEAFLKSSNPGIAIKSVKSRHEATTRTKYYAWDDDVAIMSDFANDEGYNNDLAATAADIDALFNLPKDSSMASNKRFEAAGKEKHDIMALLDYERILETSGAYRNEGAAMMQPMFEDMYITLGVDFNKGQVDGVAKFIPSEKMREVFAKFASTNVDPEMLKRLPGTSVDAVAGMHLSPEGIKLMLDKLNYTAFANSKLRQQGLTIDDLLRATTGDMVFSVNNLAMRSVTDSMEGMEGMMSYSRPQPDMDVVMAIKIGDRNALNKLLALLNQSGMPPAVNNTYTFPVDMLNQQVTLTIGDQYIVASNKAPLVTAYMNGGIKPELSGENLQIVSGHPSAMLLDLRNLMAPFVGMLGGLDPSVYTETSNLLKRFTVQGGGYKDGAMVTNMALVLGNSEENSLVQFFNYANKMSEKGKSRREVVAR